MANTLFLVTEMYPYGNGEPFLETEVKYFEEFDKVVIFPSFCGELEITRKLEINNVEIIRPTSDFFKNKFYSRIFYILLMLTRRIFWIELYTITKKKKLNLKSIIHLLSFLSKGELTYKYARKYIKSNDNFKDDKIIFYSYWMYYQAYACILLSKDFKNSNAITRAHGFDIYEYRNNENYIPLREWILSKVDRIFTISSDGYKYLKSNYKHIDYNSEISRLGTKDMGTSVLTGNNKTYTVVSCSRIVEVKRVDKIVKSLAEIKDINIRWIHFGGGGNFEYISQLSSNILPDNITFDLRGTVPNNDILNYYSKSNCHLFLNVSESEGIPVSIMEAISFGIPIIATNVGGVGEIVINKFNGFLIEKDFKESDLAALIRKVLKNKEIDYQQLRKNARRFWEENYNEKSNYTSFIRKIK
ncbi:glycosyltransferase [Ureibacillus chungkukjangi]|uniref:glycosyltransferase n=1 Tax=Ureibacillus chungkukjangi TaxID=1202712 RepID=UPI00203B5FCF|nr:glycosyltransferase [Ureibacillus chungkukjangi]MCM3386846.1 glycosyltransferase [Ureibacillus chungkukjangi]